MVLDDVARGADAVVVARAASDADVLGHRDLHVVDVVRVPDGLEHLVREAQGEEVLDRLLAEVVVDAEDRVGREDLRHDGVELARAREVVAEGLLDDHAAPRLLRRAGQPRLGELAAHDGERARRDRQVERVVAARAALGVERLDRLAQALERLVVVERALDEPDALGELAPRRLAERRARVLLDGVVHDLREVLVLPVAAREAREREARRQQAAVGEVVDRGHELLAGEVARDAEDDEPARARDPGQAQVEGSRRGLCSGVILAGLTWWHRSVRGGVGGLQKVWGVCGS